MQAENTMPGDPAVEALGDERESGYVPIGPEPRPPAADGEGAECGIGA